ncbi:MAG: Xaa-Pro peptidase family protein [Gemmatimonadota bacterium]|nr:Xaa-Pro peptidase family protein [Gemmatimonadota bacterium]
MIRRFAVAGLLVPTLLWSQPALEYTGRRADLAAKLPDGVVIALGGHDPVQDYLSFEQGPSFYYLTGFKEPDAALMMFVKGGTLQSATLFVNPRQPSREVWTGTRIGVEGVADRTGLRGRSSVDLPHVLDSLAATGIPFNVIGEVSRPPDEEGALSYRTPDEQIFDRLKRKFPSLRLTIVNDAVEQLRGTKSAAELTLIRNAVDLTLRALREVIPAVKPGMNEFELQALIEYTFRRNGADRPSFSTVVGSGPNSTTLHYNQDDRFIGANDLIVMDIGASFKGYAADVTRTVPANGIFTPEQRTIYQIVRDAQRSAERHATLGSAARLMSDSASATIANGLTRVGLIESPNATYDCGSATQPRQCAQLQLYYMHGIGHGIGLEVHDPDQYYFTGKIQAGSAFTIEPGIYVREHLLEEIPDTPRNKEFAARVRNAVTQYKNIGVRIEDNYLVTTKGVEWVSQFPREINEIEELMRKGSPGVAARDEFRVEKYRLIP